MRINKDELKQLFYTPQHVELDITNDSTFVVQIDDQLINREVAVYKSLNKLLNDINDYFTIGNHFTYLRNNHSNEIFKFNGKYYFTV